MPSPSPTSPPAAEPAVEVALAMLERRGHWLLQLRDDVEGIIAPGTWGLFGGHLDPGETPLMALRRELLEEIGWIAPALPPWFVDRDARRTVHFFRGVLPLPLEALNQREGQDMSLVSLEEMHSGRIWSPRLGECRPLAPSLRLALRELVSRG